MAEYLLDTDHLSYLQRGHPKVVRRVLTLSGSDRILTSVISIGELLRGTYLLPNSRRRRQLLQLYLQVLGQMGEVLPVDEPAAQRFAAIGAALTRKGTPIPVNDIRGRCCCA